MSVKPIHSHANRDASLRKGMPESLRAREGLRHEFDRARQAARDVRRSDGRDSGMVGKEKPQPELRPKHAQAVKRGSFNNAWLKEARDAQMARYEAEYEARQRTAPAHERNVPTPSRGYERT